MELPTEVRVTSHRPVIGRFIVAYKKLIRLLIAPYLRTVFEKVHNDTERRYVQLEQRICAIERHSPTILNFISSFANTTREFKRQGTEWNERLNTELSGVNEKLAGWETKLSGVNNKVTEYVHQLSSTQKGLDNVTKRVEFIRNETLYELMYGAQMASHLRKKSEPQVVNLEKFRSMSDDLRINIGCGHIPMDGYLNIDKRKLPDIDIIAEADYLPFEDGSISECYSSHLIEHFPNEEFKRVILPYWYALLKKEGLFRAILPDWETMVDRYIKGDYTFEKLRLVTFGAQEYDGDFHCNMFSRDGLKSMIEEVGFKDISFPVIGRINGDCYEMEVRAIK